MIVIDTNNIEKTILYRIEMELSFLYTLSGSVATARFPQLIISYRYLFNIGHRKDLEDPPKHESRDLSQNRFLFKGCITAWISSH